MCIRDRIWDGRWKLVLQEGVGPWLFDLETDPGEEENVAGGNAEMVRQLEDRLVAETTE